MISSTNTKLNIALEIAALGFRIVPVHGLIQGVCTCGKLGYENNHKPGKHPACPNGATEATTDPETIRRWYENAPWLNIGIALDADAFVVDSDPKNGGDRTLESWEAEHGPLPLTPTVRSGSGGRHVYFKRPPGVTIKNRPVAPGIDSKTIGGYVIAPPSVHESGGVYEWLEPLTTPLADAPDWLLAIVCDPVSRDDGRVRGFAAYPVNDGVDPVDEDVFVMGSGFDFESHPGASEERTAMLWRLIGTHKRRGDSVDVIEAMALAWNERNTPPLDVAKVRKHVHDLYRKPDTFSFSDSSDVDSGEGGGVVQSEDVALDRKPYAGSTPFTFTSSGPENANESETSTLTAYGLRHETEYVKPLDTFNVNETPPPLRGEGNVNESTSPNPNPNPAINAETFNATGRLETSNETGTPTRPVDESEFEDVETTVHNVPNNATGRINDSTPIVNDDAYHGIVGAIVKAIEPETEADPMGVLVSLIVHVGAAIGRGAWTEVGPARHYANEFVVIVGDTASGKGQAEDVCEYLMRLADPEFESRHGSGLSSGEGLIERVRDDESEDGGIDDDGARGASPNVTFTMRGEKRFLATEAEFGRTITVARRDGNTLSPVLRDAWDGKTMSVLTRSGSGQKRAVKPLRASDAHVSVIGHITPTELAMAMGRASGVNEIANGFANRFLWCYVSRSKLLPNGGNAGVLVPFAETFSTAVADAKRLGRITRSLEAEALWASVYESLTEARPGAYGLVVSRGRAHVVRLSFIYAALDGSRVVDVCHLRAALAVWRHCDDSARRLFGTPASTASVNSGLGGGSDDPLVIRISNAINANPGIHRRELRKSTRPDSDAAFEESLTFLETNRMAYRRNVKTSGRDAEAWFPGAPSGDDDGGDDESFTMGGMDDPSPSEDVDGARGEAASPSNVTPVPYAVSAESPPTAQADPSGLRLTACDETETEASNPSGLRHTAQTGTTLLNPHPITTIDATRADDYATETDLYTFGELTMASDKMAYFVDALTHKRMTVTQAKNPHTLTHKQLDDRAWCYRHATARAEHDARLREIASDPLPDNEFIREMLAMAGESCDDASVQAMMAMTIA